MRWLLKWKIWRIESAIKILLKSHGITPYVWSFGAVDIDPKHLVFVVGVPTDQDKNALKCNQAFLKSLNTLLIQYDWPIAAREHVVFDIESQETVDRETHGNWWHHYK